MLPFLRMQGKGPGGIGVKPNNDVVGELGGSQARPYETHVFCRDGFPNPPFFCASCARLINRTRCLGDLQADPFQPHLELHPLSGRLAGCHAVSLTHDYRITLTLWITEKEIILLDIGSHDEVYR